MKGLLIAVGPKKAPSDSEDEKEGAEEPGEDNYKKLIADALKSGDYSAAADAIEGLVQSCMGED